jgi:hypothetical protein
MTHSPTQQQIGDRHCMVKGILYTRIPGTVNFVSKFQTELVKIKLTDSV